MIAKALRKARTMSRQEWQLLMAAVRLALFVEIALRVWSLDTLLAHLELFFAPSGVSLLFQDWPARTGCAAVRASRPSNTLRVAIRPHRPVLFYLRRGTSRSDAAHPSRAECAQAVDLAYRLLPLPRTCLNESLTLFGLLRRHGIDARFCLGVRKEGERLAAHAWIEREDTPPEMDPYLPLPIPEITIPNPGTHLGC